MAADPTSPMDQCPSPLSAGDGHALHELYWQNYIRELDPRTHQEIASKVSQALRREPRTETQQQLAEAYTKAQAELCKIKPWARYFAFRLLIRLERAERRLVEYHTGRVLGLRLHVSGYEAGQILDTAHDARLPELMFLGLIDELTLLTQGTSESFAAEPGAHSLHVLHNWRQAND